MIRTVTLNTGFDETYIVSDVEFGGVSDVLQYHSEASGKGINASRTIRRLGEDVRAYALIGQPDRELFSKALLGDGIAATLATVNAPTRRNLTLLSQSSISPAAHFRAPGFTISVSEALSDLVSRLEDDCSPGDIISLHGSTPDASPPDVWCLFSAVAKRKKARLAADVYGAPLRRLLEDNPLFLCKPNEDEIRILPGASNANAETATKQALIYMLDHGVKLPAVTRGPKGIWFVEAGHLLSAAVEIDHASVLVGAGDACMAGMVAAMGQTNATFREIVAFGAAAAAAHVEGTPKAEFAKRTEILLGRAIVSDLGLLR